MIRVVYIAVIVCVVGPLLWFMWQRQSHSAELKPVEWPNLSNKWLDVRLPVTEVKRISQGHYRVVTQGTYNGQVLGLTFEFNDIDPNVEFLKNPGGGHLKATPNGVVLISQGNPTLNLIQTYASLAGEPSSNITIPQMMNLTAVTLGGEPQRIDTAVSNIKVFHADDDVDGPFYFEAYVNPHVPQGYIELNEKDPDYREPILRSFGAQF